MQEVAEKMAHGSRLSGEEVNSILQYVKSEMESKVSNISGFYQI